MAATPAPATERAPGPAPGVELFEVSKSFGTIQAVDRLSLVVATGEFLTLLGPSGCGKTTTLRLIGGFEMPTSGEITIGGRSMADRPPYLRPVNTVFQSYALFPHMTVGENVAYGLTTAGVDRSFRTRLVGQVLDLVRMPGSEDRKPAELSGGQRQRVALARALVNRPAVLLLDEPLGALDLSLRRSMQLELKRIQREVGATFIYVTHDQEEALLMSDRVAVMDQGRLLQVGTPAGVYEAPATTFVAGFIGQSNVLAGTLQTTGGNEGTVDVPGLGMLAGRLTVAVAAWAAVALTVRPERIEVVPDGDPGANSRRNELAGTLIEAAFAGTHWRLVVACPGETRIVAHRPTAGHEPLDLRPGDAVRLRFRSQDALILAD